MTRRGSLLCVYTYTSNLKCGHAVTVHSTSCVLGWLQVRRFCFLCSSFAGNLFSDVVRHIGSVHSHDLDFNIICGLDGCKRSYKKFGSYKVHLYRHHYDKLLPTKTPENVQEEVVTTPDPSILLGKPAVKTTLFYLYCSLTYWDQDKK